MKLFNCKISQNKKVINKYPLQQEVKGKKEKMSANIL